MLIEKEDLERGKEGPRYIITTKEEMKDGPSFPALSICETGALKITIDPEGNLRMKGFLKKELPLLKVGF